MKRKVFITVFALLLVFNFAIRGQGLVVDPGSCLKVETGTVLDIANGNLIICSDQTGDASLIDLGVIAYSGGGMAAVERYLTKGHWHMISLPVSSAVSGIFTGDYLIYHSENSNDWSYITSTNESLNVMQGYSLWVEGEGTTTKVFNGLTNTGNQNFNFTQSGEGFNLTGNPYPSVLDWESVTIPDELSGAIWLFDPALGSKGDYKYYISGGGAANTTSQYISSGQGFFVRATAGSGSLTLTNNARTHGGQSFYKQNSSNIMLLLKAFANNFTTQTALRFDNRSTQGLDRLFDVQKIDSESPEIPKLYSMCENLKMAINTLPGIYGNETIPVFFTTGLDGTYHITAHEIETLNPDVPVFIEDVTASVIQDLRKDPKYSFDYSAGTERKFNIHFKNVTNVPEHLSSETVYKVNLTNKNLRIAYSGEKINKGNALVVVYNLAGQKVLQFEMADSFKEVYFNEPAGMFIVNILYNETNYSTKIVQK